MSTGCKLRHLTRSIVDKDIYVKRTWFSDYFQTYLTPFIEYGMLNSNHPI